MRILAICGSLQSGSSNDALLEALAALVPDGDEVERSVSVGALPHFNPDVDGQPEAAMVEAFRTALQRADAVVIATPEYAHGMPGALKNALDWVVGTGELYGKPIAVLSAAPSVERAAHARAWTEQTLRAQGADVRLSTTVPLRRSHPDDIHDPIVRDVLTAVITSLAPGAREAGADRPL